MNKKTDSLKMIGSNDCKSINNAVDTVNTWPVIMSLFVVLLSVVLLQSAWTTLEGLYFPYAYEAVMFPYVGYCLMELYRYAQRGRVINVIKLSLMGVSFLCLYIPLVYLVASGQLSIRDSIFSDFNPALNHMPYAEYLPILCALALCLPYGVKPLTEEEKEEEKYKKGP